MASHVNEPNLHSSSKEESPEQIATEPFEPFFFFFYGTLMDPDVLRSVALLENDPVLYPATLKGFNMKLWAGRYPTLLSAESGGQETAPIKGMVWQATSLEQYQRLQRYETSAYQPCRCVVELEDGKAEDVVTFKWARDKESDELESLEGGFDLELWQESHKWELF